MKLLHPLSHTHAHPHAQCPQLVFSDISGADLMIADVRTSDPYLKFYSEPRQLLSHGYRGCMLQLWCLLNHVTHVVLRCVAQTATLQASSLIHQEEHAEPRVDLG